MHLWPRRRYEATINRWQFFTTAAPGTGRAFDGFTEPTGGGSANCLLLGQQLSNCHWPSMNVQVLGSIELAGALGSLSTETTWAEEPFTFTVTPPY